MKHSIKAIIALLSISGYAETPIGLLGGQTTDGGAYAAFIFSGNVDLTPIPGTADPGDIVTVSINGSGNGLIGGTNDIFAYVASVVAGQAANPVALSITEGRIFSVAINEPGLGLVGGVDDILNTAYAARIINGVESPLSTSADAISAVALNNSNLGLIVGDAAGVAYAAYVSANGGVTQVPNTPVDRTTFNAADINDQGKGIVCGQNGFLNNAPYAAFITPEGASPTPLSPLPSGQSFFFSVAVNNEGAGLIGGYDDSLQIYAGYSDPDGVVTPLFDSPSLGRIQGVALNDAGMGLIGGFNDTESGPERYAAFVQNGVLLPNLFVGSNPGEIASVDINHVGVGLIGGESTSPYAALVAPDGTLTELNLLTADRIRSVKLTPEQILSEVTPQVLGPFESAIYMQLTAHKALENRFVLKNKLWWRRGATQTYASIAENRENEIACNDLAWGSPKRSSTPKKVEPVCKPNSIWLEPFGDLIYLQQESPIPNFSNEVGGALLGYDREGTHYLVGATLGYAYNYVGYSNHLGHANIQEEMASFYGAYYGDHVWVGFVLWGGFYQLHNTRRTLLTTSKGKTHGWLLDPHFELASPWAIDEEELYYVEPFVQFDWVNNWQRHYTESGSSGLNLVVPSVYNSLLQSEVGLRFYERFVLEKALFCLEEKLSYINQAPFGDRSVSTSFVSSASTFPVAIASSTVQNLGAVQLLGSYVPNNTSYPYVGFSFQAMVGTSYQSYFLGLFTGIDF